jgi:hypothetical protein
MKHSTEVTAYIKAASKEQQEILGVLRKFIHEISDVTEAIKWKFPVFMKDGKDFAFIRTAKHHVTLGLNNSAKLKDPDNLLEGEGKTMKHLKIRNLDDMKPALIKSWLKQASS